MYQAVLATIKRHEEAWTGVPKFEEGVGLMEQKMTKILVLSGKIDQLKSHATQEIIEIEQTMRNKLHALVMMAKRYAETTENRTLVAELTVTKSTLRRGSAAVRMNRYGRYINMVVGLENELVDFGVSTELLIELLNLRDAFNDLLYKPRERTVKRKEINQAINDLVREIDDVLVNQLRPMVQIIGRTNPKFMRQFTAAMIIVDLRNRKSAKHTNPAAPMANDALTFDSD